MRSPAYSAWITGYPDRTRFSAYREPPAGKKQGSVRFADNSSRTSSSPSSNRNLTDS